MALDAVVNFGKVTVSTGYTSSATSIVLASGQGAKLPSTAPYNLIWWNASTYPDPADDPNVEIVTVTASATDTLTVTRGAEGTTASAKNTSGVTYKMAQGPTAKTISDLQLLTVAAPTAAENIIVNGGMQVSQFNGTNAVTASRYIVDGAAVNFSGTMATSSSQVTDAPPGYSNSLKVTITTAEASLGAGDFINLNVPIEGYRTVALAFGGASAQSMGVGFWFKAFQTGTFSGAIVNGSGNRSYPFSFSYSATATWQFITVLIPGDVTGTWGVTTGTAFYFVLCFASGSTYLGTANTWAAANYKGATGTTNGASSTSNYFQVTGVMAFAGIDLTQFNQTILAARAPNLIRPFPVELALCQRYYETTYAPGTVPGTATNVNARLSDIYVMGNSASNLVSVSWPFKVTKRATPSMTYYSPSTGASGKIRDAWNGADVTPVSSGVTGPDGDTINATVSASSTRIIMAMHGVADARLQ